MDPTEPPGLLVAKYANFFQIGHNEFEFVLDFGQSYAESTILHSRIVMSPVYAKLLLGTLAESVKQYETNIGEIPQAQ